MTSTRVKKVFLLFLILTTLLTVACHPKTPVKGPDTNSLPPRTEPPPATPAPAITLTAQPSTINRGQSTTLNWEARNSATVRIEPGLGEVAATGNRSVNPASSVTYTATATGPGGTATAVARITVNTPTEPAAGNSGRPSVSTNPLTPDEVFHQNVKDVLFDYDKAEIRSDQVATLQGNAAWLKANPNVRMIIEGHCDERGSEEYNLALGDRRANAVKEYLISQGVQSNRINTVSYGEERPVCREETDACFAMNRRAAFTPAQ